jgi:hypothetical protein
MRREFALAAMLIFGASPVLAAARCNQPYAPQFHGGAGATKQEIMNMRDDAQTFIAASDIYQACLLKSGMQDARVKVEANQREKVRVGNAYRAAAAAYKSAQAGTASLDDLEIVSR